MPMKEGRVQDKVSKDLKKLYEDLPKVLEIPKPLELMLSAAKEAEKEVLKRSPEEE